MNMSHLQQRTALLIADVVLFPAVLLQAVA